MIQLTRQTSDTKAHRLEKIKCYDIFLEYRKHALKKAFDSKFKVYWVQKIL